MKSLVLITILAGLMPIAEPYMFPSKRELDWFWLERFELAQEELLGEKKGAFDGPLEAKLCETRNERLSQIAKTVENRGVLQRTHELLVKFQNKRFVNCTGIEKNISPGIFTVYSRLFDAKATRGIVQASHRRALVDHTRTTRRLKALIVRVLPRNHQDSSNLDSQFVDQVATLVNQFYMENSNGLQSFDFELHPSVVFIDSFAMESGQGSDYVCSGAGYKPNSGSIANDAKMQLGELAATYDRLIYSLPYCKNLGFAGQGSAPGSTVWMNGLENSVAGYAKVLAHELGHNNGALVSIIVFFRCFGSDAAMPLTFIYFSLACRA